MSASKSPACHNGMLNYGPVLVLNWFWGQTSIRRFALAFVYLSRHKADRWLFLPADILKKLLNEVWLLSENKTHRQLQVLVTNSNKLSSVFRDKG